MGNVDSGANVTHATVQDGIDAYYNLIAKSYLGNGKTAKDLVNNFVNRNDDRYASNRNYEAMISSIAKDVNRTASGFTNTSAGS